MEEANCVQGVAVVIERDGCWLAIRRAEGVEAPGCWCFPGGAIEPGETPADAVVRETREEVGLRVEPIEALWHWQRPDGNLALTWWRAKLVGDGGELRIDASEVAETRWVSPGGFRRLEPLLPSNLAFLDSRPPDPP